MLKMGLDGGFRDADDFGDRRTPPTSLNRREQVRGHAAPENASTRTSSET